MLYRLLSSIFPWLGLINLLVKSVRQPGYRARIKERFGFSPFVEQREIVWFHAVSVGEVIALSPLLEQFLDAYPDESVLVTTTTPTGSAEILQRFSGQIDHCYMPFDAMRCVQRFLLRTKPKALFLMETELWPNLLKATLQHQIPTCLLNARLSERSAGLYGRVGNITSQMIGALHRIVCQYQDTADRFRALGASENQVVITGSMKFDLKLTGDLIEETNHLIRTWRGERLCWIAGSTHQGEDEVVLDAHLTVKKEFPELLLILAPRHVHRASHIRDLARRRSFSIASLSDESRTVDVLLVDQMGKLLQMYGMANVAFIGGSLEGTGGHNPVEPAIFGTPMLMGPDRMNFEVVSDLFKADSCLTTVRNASELARELTDLLADDDKRARQGQAARTIVESNQGAIDRQFGVVCEVIDSLTQQASR